MFTPMSDLSDYRKRAGLSQDALAKLLALVGPPATQSLVSQWENGDVVISAERAVQVERATAGAIPRGALRPDLFGDPPPVEAAA